MNDDECSKLLGRLQLTERNQRMIKNVLVDGRKQTDVAREFGISKQILNRNIKKTINASEKINRDDWRYSAMILPDGLCNLMNFLSDKANNKTPKSELKMTAKQAEYLIDALAEFRKG